MFNGMGGQSLPEEIAENVTAPCGFRDFGIEYGHTTESRWRTTYDT